METKNISTGLKRIFQSKLMTLIGQIIMTVGGVLALVGAVAVLSDALTGGEAFDLGMEGLYAVGGMTIVGSVFTWIGLAFIVIALILMLVGLGTAAKDDGRFKTLFVFALISIGCTIATGFIPANLAVLSSILKIASTIIDLLLVIFLLTYTSEALMKKGNAELAEKGLRVQKLILVILLIVVIVQFISLFAPTAAGIISVVALILQIIYWFSFMIFLSKAAKALA